MMPQKLTIADARGTTDYGPWLYRLYSEAGDLLYVGTTKRKLSERFNQHSRIQPWWSEVHAVSLERFPAGWEALDAERAAIKAEAPAFNRRSAAPCGS